MNRKPLNNEDPNDVENTTFDFILLLEEIAPALVTLVMKGDNR